MDTEKILAQVDQYFSENKGRQAEILLEESIKQAMAEGDDNALLPLLNEMLGYKRETSQVEASYTYADLALKLLEKMGLMGTLAHATTLLNIANAYRAGGRLQDSMARYQEVLNLYPSLIPENDMLFASLHNNISLLYQEMGDFSQAKEHLEKALAIVQLNKDQTVDFEEAVTYANLAATCLNLNQDEEAVSYFKQAISIFEAKQIGDSHYAAALSSMGAYYYKQERFEEAEGCFIKAMAALKASLGETEAYHRLAENLAACRRAMGKEAPAAGLALCREYFEAYGLPMLKEQFPKYLNQIAAGLCGEGSDCFGFDDEISQDHDWGPGFSLWVSDAVFEQIGPALKEAYDRLPREYRGYSRKETPMGQNRTNVCTIRDFYGRLLGPQAIEWTDSKDDTDTEKRADCPENASAFRIDWAQLPDEALAAAVNGQVFMDGEGTFSAIRKQLAQGFPEDLLYLKLAEASGRFSQGAQYNFPRMQKRQDPVAARLSLDSGLINGMKIIYYVNRKFPPHEKWLYRGLLELPKTELPRRLIAALFSVQAEQAQLSQPEQAQPEQTWSPEQAQLEQTVEQLGAYLSDLLYKMGFVSVREPYLDFYTGELVQKAELATKSDETLIDEITRLEYEAFDQVQNTGGRASCQNDWPTFEIMRKSQYMTWPRTMLLQYRYEFAAEYEKGRNYIEEKYGRMMESTHPEEYAKIARYFPALSEEKKAIIDAVTKIQVGFMEDFAAEYPGLAANARQIHTFEDTWDDTSYETYLRGELGTYSDQLLGQYGRFIVALCQSGKNLARMTMENSVHLYGYQSLSDAEEKKTQG